MILPIYIYGQPVLRKKSHDITPEYPDIHGLVENMFETMYKAEGIGLAAPQVGLDIRLFVIDLAPLAEDNEEFASFKKVFINAVIEEYSDENVTLQEGCLSLPGINEPVSRPKGIRIKYLDENFKPHDEVYEGFYARCIQHEYDHIEGVLFIDKMSAIRKQLIMSKLNNLLKGNVKCTYRIKPVQSKHK